MARPIWGLVKYAAAIWGAYGLGSFLWRIPGLLGFVGAYMSGDVVNGTPLSLLYVLFWALVELWLVALAWGVVKGSGAARSRLLVILGVLSVYALVRAVLAPPPPESIGVVGLLLSAWFLKDLLMFGVLVSPGAGKAMELGSGQEWAGHAARMTRVGKIAGGWKNVGQWGNTVLVPVVFGSFLLAPFTYAAAGVFFLMVVLPLRPGFSRPG
jgi:hypothetical protein